MLGVGRGLCGGDGRARFRQYTSRAIELWRVRGRRRRGAGALARGRTCWLMGCDVGFGVPGFGGVVGCQSTGNLELCGWLVKGRDV